MKIKMFLLLLINAFIFISCDILRTSLFEVVSCTPGNGYQPEPENIIISLDFSHEPDKASVEKNFSLTGDGNRVKGIYSWNDKKMVFSPLTPLEEFTDYTITLSAEAHDTKGLSMDEAFNRYFSTRPDNTRPVLVSSYPEMYSEITEPREEIKLEFSLPVPIKTLYENVSFSPSMTGIWRLENDDKLAIFTPAEPWTQKTRYEIKYSTSLTDKNKMNIGNDFLCIFTTKSDFDIPYLVNAMRITNKNELITLSADRGYTSVAESPVENQDLEKDDKLKLVFSKPVDSVSVKNYISVESGPNLIMETPAGYETEYIFKFESIPVYESRFTVKIKSGIKDATGNESKEDYIYRFFANGKFSKPPTLAGIRIPMSPNSITDNELIFYETDSLFLSFPITVENYPSGENTYTWIELYFLTAEGASIDLFSLMDLFRIDTSNNVISFSPRQVKDSNFSTTEPHIGMEDYQRIEIMGYLTNTTNFGIVNIQISAGLKDSLGNCNENLLKISLLK